MVGDSYYMAIPIKYASKMSGPPGKFPDKVVAKISLYSTARHQMELLYHFVVPLHFQ